MLEYVQGCNPTRVVAVGNPPYQELEAAGRASARPIYNYFIESLMDSSLVTEFALIVPSRWFAAGKNLDSFRKRMRECKQIKKIKHFSDSKEIFPTVRVKGGICFLNWKRGHEGLTLFESDNTERHIDLSAFDIVLDDPAAASIVQKVLKYSKQKFVSDVAWSQRPFGIETNYFQKNVSLDPNDKDAIPCMVIRGVIKYANRTHIKRKHDYIESYKVCVPKAYGRGGKRCTLPKERIFIINPGVIATATYSVVETFTTREDAEKFAGYLKTSFARFLLGLRKITQDIKRSTWKWVPLMDTSQEWTDEALFQFFGLSQAEQDHVRLKEAAWT